MFHFKLINIITTCLFLVSLVLIFLAQLSPIIVIIALALLAVSFGLLTYILYDDYIVYSKIIKETKYELLMELATSENANEYITRPEIFDKKDQKQIKAQKRSKQGMIILSAVMCLSFLVLLILNLIA